jgi:hypothetical protein
MSASARRHPRVALAAGGSGGGGDDPPSRRLSRELAAAIKILQQARLELIEEIRRELAREGEEDDG